MKEEKQRELEETIQLAKEKAELEARQQKEREQLLEEERKALEVYMRQAEKEQADYEQKRNEQIRIQTAIERNRELTKLEKEKEEALLEEQRKEEEAQRIEKEKRAALEKALNEIQQRAVEDYIRKREEKISESEVYTKNRNKWREQLAESLETAKNNYKKKIMQQTILEEDEQEKQEEPAAQIVFVEPEIDMDMKKALRNIKKKAAELAKKRAREIMKNNPNNSVENNIEYFQFNPDDLVSIMYMLNESDDSLDQENTKKEEPTTQIIETNNLPVLNKFNSLIIEKKKAETLKKLNATIFNSTMPITNTRKDIHLPLSKNKPPLHISQFPRKEKSFELNNEQKKKENSAFTLSFNKQILSKTKPSELNTTTHDENDHVKQSLKENQFSTFTVSAKPYNMNWMPCEPDEEILIENEDYSPSKELKESNKQKKSLIEHFTQLFEKLVKLFSKQQNKIVTATEINPETINEQEDIIDEIEMKNSLRIINRRVKELSLLANKELAHSNDESDLEYALKSIKQKANQLNKPVNLTKNKTPIQIGYIRTERQTTRTIATADAHLKYFKQDLMPINTDQSTIDFYNLPLNEIKDNSLELNQDVYNFQSSRFSLNNKTDILDNTFNIDSSELEIHDLEKETSFAYFTDEEEEEKDDEPFDMEYTLKNIKQRARELTKLKINNSTRQMLNESNIFQDDQEDDDVEYYLGLDKKFFVKNINEKAKELNRTRLTIRMKPTYSTIDSTQLNKQEDEQVFPPTITTTPLSNEQFMHEFQIIDENELISKFNLIQVQPLRSENYT